MPPTSTDRLRLLIALLALATTAAACGLRPEAQDAIAFAPVPGAGAGAGGDALGAPLPLTTEGEELAGVDDLDSSPGTTPSGTPATTATGGRSGSGTTGGSTTTGGTGGTTGGSGGTTGGGTTGGSGGGTTGGSGGSTGGSGGTAGGSGGGTTGGQGGAQGGDQQGAGQPGGDQGGGGAAIRGQDRTGVDADAGSINVAIHAPVTGAAPLPVTSFEEARDLYFRHALAEQGDIGGFTQFNISFADDRYQPSTAVQACRQLAASNFLLVGAGGTDQIQACGRFADSAGIPYFSAGVTEAGLAGLRNYFAFSMSYRQQGALLAQYVAANFPGQRVAAIITDTENFTDAVQGWEAGVQQTGLDYFQTLRHPKGDTSWYSTFANTLAQNDVDIVYINTAPVDYIRFAQQAANQGFTPQYVGVGVTMGLNAVLGSGCDFVDGGIFFSPFPGLDWARENEREFFQAAERFGTPSDDIALALWAQGKILAELLESYEARYGSNDVTREDFRDLVEGSSISSGIFPDLSYSAQDHFGADQVHVLRANCATGEHETLASFAGSF